MIRVKAIHIEEFRGIRSLDLELGAKNFGICGPNGTGKSGVVDAIEFCITGDVTRLSGEGSLGLSVKAHAPHVDQSSHPELSSVTITADIPSLGKLVKIHRSVKNPRKFEVTPNDADVKAIIEELQTHPEFALSRREIIKYIITPPGKRSEEVQTLLRLEHIEKLRKSLTTFCNNQKGEAEEADRAFSMAEAELKNAFQIDELTDTILLKKVNEKREILGLQTLSELCKDTSFKTGVTESQGVPKKPILKKVEALADLSALHSAINKEEPSDLVKNRQFAKTALEKLKSDEKALMLARQQGFIKMGLDLITENNCPLCDSEWDADKLREHLREKLLSAKEIEELMRQLQDNINGLLQPLSERIQAVERAIKYSQSLQPPIDKTELSNYLNALKKLETELTNFLKDRIQIKTAIEAVSNSWWLPKTEQNSQIEECLKAVKALPDTSAEDKAQDILIVAQERYEKLLSNKTTADKKKDCRLIAQNVLDHYNKSRTSVLEGIYDKVTTDFINYYRVINSDDEQKFIGKLTSEPAKLSFDVDFYGRGLFPPGAYHSEGHQDGMGLCLYLALMKHTLGNNFTFAVLDDVLMSIDTGHRRDVCRLLKSEFPNTQFILTTHDRVWLQYMKTEGLINQSKSFGGWTVDTGPRVWDDKDIWTEIQSELGKNDVAKAAWLLRRYLEFSANILADNLRAKIEFRGDGNYDLGDLLPNVLKEWQAWLLKGEKSAEYWDRKEEKELIAKKRATTKELIAKASVEQWAINPSVHFNEWANLQCHEMQEVVDAFRNLLEQMRCQNSNCKSHLHILPRKNDAELMCCNCGETSINLKTSK